MKMALIVLIGLSLAGCGVSAIESDRYHAFDAVKNLRAERDSEVFLYQQSSYSIHPHSRLLMRYEELLTLSDTMLVNADHAARVELSVSHIETKDDAALNLRVCPMNRNWMMLANWYVAHPFGGGESWANPGGDYVRTDCVKGESLSGSSPTLSFNVSNWISQYVFSRSINYGLIVINDDSTEVEIVGDGAGYLAPRLVYDKLTPVVTTEPDWNTDWQQ